MHSETTATSLTGSSSPGASAPVLGWDPTATSALSGVKVLDLARFIAGPLCAQNLGDLGADVIKVERIGGEDTRHNEPRYADKSLYTMLFNRNKRGISLDSRSAEGREILRGLAEWADVIVENFRPGTLTKMGLDPDELRAAKPGLIIVSISGFGQTGPYRDRVLFDCIAQAMSGLMDMNAGKDAVPQLTKMFPADSLAAVYATVGALSALFHRERTGQGQVVDVSVMDSLISALGTALPGYLVAGTKPAHNGNRDDYNAPANIFPVTDGYVYLHAGTAAFWKRFCTEIAGRPQLVDDPRYHSVPARMAHIDEVEALVTEWTSVRTGLEVETAFEKVGIPCTRVADIPSAAQNEQVWQRQMLFRTQDTDGDEVVLVGNPVKLSDTPAILRVAPPRVGEHTENVLQSVLGLPDDRIRTLQEKGVV